MQSRAEMNHSIVTSVSLRVYAKVNVGGAVVDAQHGHTKYQMQSDMFAAHFLSINQLIHLLFLHLWPRWYNKREFVLSTRAEITWQTLH